MRLGQLRAFHEVASHGSFTTAARALHVSQPAVTAQVKALESHYRIELFLRRSRGVDLTPKGRQLYGITVGLFERVAEAQEFLDASTGQLTGVMRIGADAPYHLIGLLTFLRERHPGVVVQVTLGNSRQIEDSLRDFRVDVAVLAAYRDDGRLEVLPFIEQNTSVLVPVNHPWAAREQVELCELAGCAMVRREAGSATQKAFDEACRKAGVRLQTVLEIGSREAMREAVAAGLGVGVVSLPEAGTDDRVRALTIRSPSVVTREYLVCLASRRRSGMVRVFFDLAEDVLTA